MNDSSQSKQSKYEANLLKQFLKGDLNAYNQIVDDYHTRVYRLAYKFTQNDADAQDIAQETFLRAYENLVKHPKEVNLKPWLMTICVNLCRNLAKKKKNFNFSALMKEDSDQEFQDMIADVKTLNPHEKEVQRQTQDAVHDALDKIAPKYKVIVQLRYIESMSYQEISEALALPINTVKVHLNRAKKYLKTYLQPVIDG